MNDGGPEREAFEEAAFAQYFLSGIRRTNDRNLNAASIHFVPSKQKSKDEFVARNDEGSYVDDTLNSAWWAWQTRAEMLAARPQEANDAR